MSFNSSVGRMTDQGLDDDARFQARVGYFSFSARIARL